VFYFDYYGIGFTELSGSATEFVRSLVLLGTIDSGGVPSDETSWMETPAVIPSTAVTIATAPIMVAAAVTIAATAEVAGAGVTPGIGISTTAGVGSRSRATPTTAAPG
jgi:hypothetical protein